jgi:hypothetical protein
MMALLRRDRTSGALMTSQPFGRRDHFLLLPLRKSRPSGGTTMLLT